VFYQNEEQKNWCIIYIVDLLSSAENDGNVFMSLLSHKKAKLVAFPDKDLWLFLVHSTQ